MQIYYPPNDINTHTHTQPDILPYSRDVLQCILKYTEIYTWRTCTNSPQSCSPGTLNTEISQCNCSARNWVNGNTTLNGVKSPHWSTNLWSTLRMYERADRRGRLIALYIYIYIYRLTVCQAHAASPCRLHVLNGQQNTNTVCVCIWFWFVWGWGWGVIGVFQVVEQRVLRRTPRDLASSDGN